MRFTPPAPGVGDIEVSTLDRIRERGGPQEFVAPQRVEFDLVMRIESGTTRHRVDFSDHRLSPGDVMWVRAGQVQQWGRIDAIEGPVVLFGPHTVDDRTRELIRSHSVRVRNHWPEAELRGSPVAPALGLLIASSSPHPADAGELRQSALAHSLAALLAQLALVQPQGGSLDSRPTHEAYRWFRDHIEEHFRTWHHVSEYADRLGYSAHTLNRLSRLYTGLSAKELVDERVALEAKRLLNHSDAPVAEIAGELGFDDASNFSTYFRRNVGVTPAAFRTGSRRGDLGAVD